MPTNRILYTLQDIKAMLTERHPTEEIEIYDCLGLMLQDEMGPREVEDASYLFQVTEIIGN